MGFFFKKCLVFLDQKLTREVFLVADSDSLETWLRAVEDDIRCQKLLNDIPPSWAYSGFYTVGHEFG